MLQFWKAFDLDSKRVMLDTQGGTMKTEKENSLKSRKKLAETTKSFRKLSDADKANGMGPLLRAYQEEIDSLTRRAKYSENAFFMLYKGLYTAPDPVPSLEMANDSKVAELEEDNRRLKREVHDFEVEFASLKNQDITIRKLEEQLASMESEMDDLVHQKVEHECRDLEEQLATKEFEFAQQRMDYERQLENSRSELREAFTRMDAMQSDLFAVKQRSGLAKNTFDAEMDAFSQETILTQTLQLENAQLKKQIDELLGVATDPFATKADLSASAQSSLTALELSEKESTIRTLRQEIFVLKESVAASEERAQNEKTAYEEAVAEARRAIEKLNTELAARPTLEKHSEVLHQLHIFQQLEYNVIDDDDAPSNSFSPADDAESSLASTEAEKVLLARVRRLEHALQKSELAVDAHKSQLEQVSLEVEKKTLMIEEQTKLVRNLEESVAVLESRKGLMLNAPVGAAPDMGTEILLDAMEDQFSERKAWEARGTDVGVAGAAGSDNKMLEIVRGQRDRFRDRMKELQTENNKLEEIVRSHKTSVSRLENDNMQLYHKIRYLQSYNSNSNRGGSSGSSGTSHRVAPSQSLEDGAGGGGGDVEARYKGMYEEKMNPFVQFNKLESQQRYTNLNTVDKVLLNSARLFLGHRITRNMAFGYILLLHFLVFATLYSFMHGCGISNE